MPPLRGCPPLSPPPLSPPPSRPDGRERAPEPIFERVSPSSPVRSGGRMGEEGRGDEGQRTEDAKSDKVKLREPLEPPVEYLLHGRRQLPSPPGVRRLLHD